MHEETLNALIRQPENELSKPLLESERDVLRFEDLLAATAVCRRTPLDDVTLVVYVSQIASLDGEKYAHADVEWALRSIASESRGEYETSFPSLGELLDRIELERKKRTKQDRQAECDERLESYRAYAEKIRLERESEWNLRVGRNPKSATMASQRPPTALAG